MDRLDSDTWDINSEELNVEIEEIENIEINDIKIVHYYFQDEDSNDNFPISTSIGLESLIDLETGNKKWIKTTEHTYSNENIESFEEEMDFDEIMMNKINSLNLPNLKNNYFTEELSTKFSRWEIHYNQYFKIVGTYDRIVKEFEELSNLLGLKYVLKAKKGIKLEEIKE